MADYGGASYCSQADVDNLETLCEPIHPGSNDAQGTRKELVGAWKSVFFGSSAPTRRRKAVWLAIIGKKYVGEKADLRPDLLLNEDLVEEYLLIEFKRPSHALKREGLHASS